MVGHQIDFKFSFLEILNTLHIVIGIVIIFILYF
jgi:hypothetical protein